MPNNFEASHEACQPKETQKPSIGPHGGEMTVQHMGGCQNYGPFMGTLNIRCRIILSTPKRDPILENYPYVRHDQSHTAQQRPLALSHLFPPTQVAAK